MKKLVLGMLALALTLTVSAQNLSFGPTVGFGHSWMTGAENVKFKPGFNVGGTLVYSFVPHWGVGADIRASFMEGVRSKIENGNTSIESKVNATYLRIPVKLYHFFGDYGDRVRPKIYIGPSVGFLLGGKIKGETTIGNTSTETEADTKDYLKGIDFGFIAGAGANFRLQRNTWLNLDLVYGNGLIDVTEANNYSAHRNLSLNVGVTFPLGTVIPAQ